MSFSTLHIPGIAEEPLIPQQGQPMRNVMIDVDLDDPIPRSRSNPLFETSPRFPNETRDDTLPPTVPGLSSIFQRAHEVDIGGNPSFVNGNVYHYNHYNHVTRNLAQISSVEFAARRNERRADIIKQLGEEVKELNQLLQEKTEELSRMEDTANRQNAKQAEVIKRLEADVRRLDQLLQKKTEELSRMEDDVKQQNEKQAEVIKRLEADFRKLDQLLQEKTKELSRVEDTANRQNAKQAIDLKQANTEVRKLNQLLQEKTVELASMKEAPNRQKQEIDRLEWKHEKEIQRLESIVASISEQESKPEKEIGGLRPKVSTEEDAKHPGKRRTQDPPKSPDATKRSSAAANQKINRSAQQPGAKKEPLQIPSPSIKTNIPSPLVIVPKADTLSVTDVRNLVEALNAEIGQMAAILPESLSDPEEPPTSDNESEIDFGELRNYLGPGLCDKLKGKSEFDPLLTQLSLQMGLVNACSSVVNDSPFLHSGSILQTLYSKMTEKEGQTAADEWRAKAFNYFDLPQCEDANKKYLTEILLKLTTAAGGTLESNKSLLSQYNQRLEMIVKSAAKLHKTVTEDMRSVELVTYTVPCDTEFDASQMEDSENQGSTLRGKVICTQEMGLLCRKRAEPQNGSLKDWGVITKAKVVLASILEW